MSFNFCPKCGTENEESDPFCGNCGHGSSLQENSNINNETTSTGSKNTNENKNLSNDIITFSSAMELYAAGYESIISNAIKGRKYRKNLEANFPGCDSKQIGLTPYGKALLTCASIYLEVMARSNEFEAKFACENNELLEKTISDIQDRIFIDMNPTVPVVTCTGAKLDSKDPADCPLDFDEHNLADMVLFTSYVMFDTTVNDPMARLQMDPHHAWHRTAAFSRYAMGCSEFVFSLKGFLSEENYLKHWLVGCSAFHQRSSANGGVGFISDERDWTRG